MADTKFIAGNWKMNGMQNDGMQRITQIISYMDENKAALKDKATVLICPPATLLTSLYAETKSSAIFLGAQDCHSETSGAFTGDISAEMLKECGGTYVIVGHSERRHGHQETNALIAKKAEAVHRAGMSSIICVGETAEQRANGDAEKTIQEQIVQSMPQDTVYADNALIAYEPVWAIGSGQTATQQDIEGMHNFIRNLLREKYPSLAETHILYGGSVKGSNAKQILNYENVDGVLVGGASLKAPDFCRIIEGAA